MLDSFDTDLMKKMVVSIGDASRITGVPTRKIQYWENKGIIHSVADGQKVNRKYDYFAVKRIILINELVEEGYVLDKAAEKIEARFASTENAYKQMKEIDKGDAPS